MLNVERSQNNAVIIKEVIKRYYRKVYESFDQRVKRCFIGVLPMAQIEIIRLWGQLMWLIRTN